MEVKVTDREFPSTDGIHQLKGKMYVPEGQPKAIFHVVHGMTEHIGRYDAFFQEMAQNGYVVVAYDNLGHGKTATDDSELGFIAKKNGWKKLTDDVYAVSKVMKDEYPGLPYYLMGHSMGSFIVRNAAATYPDLMDKLVVMGTGGPMAATKPAIGLINIIKFFRGKRSISRFIEKLAFGEYKFCNYHFTLSAMHDLVKINDAVNKKKWFKKISKTLPILLVSGADDPVGDHGKGVKKVYKLLKKRGANVTMKLYDNNRHEILNDTARDEVIADINRFLDGEGTE